MAGEAKTTNFAVGTATVMLGPLASLMDLNSANHSIGLVKNLSVNTDATYLELTQGVRNNLVYSVMTGQTTRITAEVYEMTARNLTYGLGLDGTALVAQTAATTLSTNMNANVALAQMVNGAVFNVSDWISFQPDLTSDEVQFRKITAIATNNVTVSANVPLLIPAGALVKRMNFINVAGEATPDFLSMKVAGQLADGAPVVMLFPKVRITKGFTMGFNTDNYGNLPFEIAAYAQVPTDPFFATIKAQAVLGITS